LLSLSISKQDTEIARVDYLAQQFVHMVKELTYFFRNQPQFKALRELILPHLIVQRRPVNRRSLRQWSAGCATGERPYALARFLRDFLPN
jgi:chemotaxis protein methyltransferase CheR